MKSLYDWIWNLVIYFILVTAVTSVLPGETYRKYIRLFTGVVMILVMAHPLLELFSMDTRIEEVFRRGSFEQERETLRENMEGMEDVGQEYVMEHYRMLLTGKLKELAEEEDVQLSDIEFLIEEDDTSSRYGSILYLSARTEHGKEEFIRKVAAEFGIPVENINIK